MGCFVTRRKAPMRTAARMARYRASSPEETEMLRTKGLRVPKMNMDAISIQEARWVFCMGIISFPRWYSLYQRMGPYARCI